MQILQNLPKSYSGIIDVITNKTPFPSFYDTRDMLLVHEAREHRSDLNSETLSDSSSALYAQLTRVETGKKRNKSNNNKNRNSGRSASKGGQNSGVFAGNPGGGTQASPHQPQQHQQHQHPSSYQQQFLPQQQQFSSQHNRPSVGYFSGPPPSTAQQQWGLPPPSPWYGYGYPYMPYPNHGPVASSPHGFVGHATSTPTDLASVFSSMSLQQPPADPNYYMDTGASSHMTYNPGS